MVVKESDKVRTASVNIKTGIIYINPSFHKLPYFVKLFLLCHEYAHYFLQSPNEIEVDALAHTLYTKLGGSQKESVFALTRVLPFEGGAKKEQIKRVKNQLNRAKIFAEYMENQEFNANLAVIDITNRFEDGDIEGAISRFNAVRNLLDADDVQDIEELFATETFEGEHNNCPNWREMTKEQIAALAVMSQRKGNHKAYNMLVNELRNRSGLGRNRKRGFEGDENFQAEGKKGLFGGLKKTVADIKSTQKAKADAKAAQKQDKAAAKVELKKARADAIRTKANAKMSLAQQGIASGPKFDQILGAVGGLAQSAASFATGNIAGGLEGLGNAANRIAQPGEQLSPLPPPENTPETPLPKEEKKVPTWAWITGGAVLLAVIAVILYFVLRKKA